MLKLRGSKGKRGAAHHNVEPVAAPAEAGVETSQKDHAVEQEQIATLAYSYWQARGREGCSAEEDWFRAERELKTSGTAKSREKQG